MTKIFIRGRKISKNELRDTVYKVDLTNVTNSYTPTRLTVTLSAHWSLFLATFTENGYLKFHVRGWWEPIRGS